MHKQVVFYYQYWLAHICKTGSKNGQLSSTILHPVGVVFQIIDYQVFLSSQDSVFFLTEAN